MEYTYKINGNERTVKLEGNGDLLTAVLDEREYAVELIPVNNNNILLRIDGRNYPVRYARNEDGVHVMLEGWSFTAVEPGEGESGGAGAGVDIIDGIQTLVAPMPGQVVKVNVKVGDIVKAKQCLVIVEAMKMENELNTAIDGTVTAVHAVPGQQVDAMQPLVEVMQNGEESQNSDNTG